MELFAKIDNGMAFSHSLFLQKNSQTLASVLNMPLITLKLHHIVALLPCASCHGIITSIDVHQYHGIITSIDVHLAMVSLYLSMCISAMVSLHLSMCISAMVSLYLSMCISAMVPWIVISINTLREKTFVFSTRNNK